MDETGFIVDGWVRNDATQEYWFYSNARVTLKTTYQRAAAAKAQREKLVLAFSKKPW